MKIFLDKAGNLVKVEGAQDCQKLLHFIYKKSGEVLSIIIDGEKVLNIEYYHSGEISTFFPGKAKDKAEIIIC